MESETITMQHIITAADRIAETGKRCYEKAREKGAYDQANRHRSACLDHLEGLKSVMIVAQLHNTITYEYLTKLWDNIIDWP